MPSNVFYGAVNYRYGMTSQYFGYWELGSANPGFTVRAGLADHHATYLRIYPLSFHAIFPFVFRRQVGKVS
jgi:hypothetical protein